MGNCIQTAPKASLIQNILLEREKERFILFSFWGNPMDSPPKLRALHRALAGNQAQSSTIANVSALKISTVHSIEMFLKLVFGF